MAQANGNAVVLAGIAAIGLLVFSGLKSQKIPDKPVPLPPPPPTGSVLKAIDIVLG